MSPNNVLFCITSTVVNNLGRFTRKDLSEIWHEDHYADMQDELLQLMINFKLCYQIPGTRDTYIAPRFGQCRADVRQATDVMFDLV